MNHPERVLDSEKVKVWRRKIADSVHPCETQISFSGTSVWLVRFSSISLWCAIHLMEQKLGREIELVGASTGKSWQDAGAWRSSIGYSWVRFTIQGVELTKVIEHSLPFSPNGYVYFIADGDKVKIGKSTDPNRRLKDLQVASSQPLTTLLIMPNGSREAEIHKMFASLRIKGEWFRLTDEVKAFIKEQSPSAVITSACQ